MTSHDSRPSGCTPFEEELVKAMNDFANAADAPRFDTAGIVRRSRRRRTAAIAGLATALIAVGGGTALATGVTSGSHVAHTAAGPTGKSDDTVVRLGLADGGSVPIQLAGMDSTLVRQEFLKGGLHADFAKAARDGKPGSVIAVAPHSPTVVRQGDTVKVTLCAG